MDDNKNINAEEQEELELTDDQVERLDEIDNAAFEYLKVLTENEDLEWNMEFIGELNEFAADMMAKAGHKIRYPYIETAPDGTQQRKDYYEPDKPAGTMIDGAFWDSQRFDHNGYLEEDGSVPDYFHKYGVRISRDEAGSGFIWARSEEEAMLIADEMTEAEMNLCVGRDHVGCKVKMEGRKND